jgi:hypothetical protein
MKSSTDPIWLALWLFSIVGVLIGLCFVWGSTDVSLNLSIPTCMFVKLNVLDPSAIHQPFSRYSRTGETLSNAVFNVITHDPSFIDSRACGCSGSVGILIPPSTNGQACTHCESKEGRVFILQGPLKSNTSIGHCSSDSLCALHNILVGVHRLIRGRQRRWWTC